LLNIDYLVCWIGSLKAKLITGIENRDQKN